MNDEDDKELIVRDCCRMKNGKLAGVPTPYNEVICQLVEAKQSFYLKK